MAVPQLQGIDVRSQYCYDYPHPAVTTDVVLFSLIDCRLSLLLIRRAFAPFKGSWALPGGFVDIDESLIACAQRELTEETGLENPELKQLHTYGRPDRDPRERVISVVYYGVTSSCGQETRVGTDAS